MENEFNIALEKIYHVFSKYRYNPKISACSCCVSKSDKVRLQSKKLRELEDEDLSFYAFKAISTFGDVNDFKHYMPRIFELATKRQLTVDYFVILEKLKFGAWEFWPMGEQKAVHDFLLAWWKYDINHASYFDSEILIEIYKKIKDLELLLDFWKLEKQGLKNFVDFVQQEFSNMKRHKKPFKVLSKRDIEIFTDWVECNYYRLDKYYDNLYGI